MSNKFYHIIVHTDGDTEVRVSEHKPDTMAEADVTYFDERELAVEELEFLGHEPKNIEEALKCAEEKEHEWAEV